MLSRSKRRGLDLHSRTDADLNGHNTGRLPIRAHTRTHVNCPRAWAPRGFNGTAHQPIHATQCAPLSPSFRAHRAVEGREEQTGSGSWTEQSLKRRTACLHRGRQAPFAYCWLNICAAPWRPTAAHFMAFYARDGLAAPRMALLLFRTRQARGFPTFRPEGWRRLPRLASSAYAPCPRLIPQARTCWAFFSFAPSSAGRGAGTAMATLGLASWPYCLPIKRRGRYLLRKPISVSLYSAGLLLAPPCRAVLNHASLAIPAFLPTRDGRTGRWLRQFARHFFNVIVGRIKGRTTE